MQSIGDILKSRIEAFNKDPVLAIKTVGKEYQKKYSKGIDFFVLEINKERKQQGLPELPYIAIRQKLIALKEINDLRWFYGVCKKYSTTKDKQGNQNTFSKAFFGALK